jgi:hypothetical protein
LRSPALVLKGYLVHCLLHKCVFPRLYSFLYETDVGSMFGCSGSANMQPPKLSQRHSLRFYLDPGFVYRCHLRADRAGQSSNMADRVRSTPDSDSLAATAWAKEVVAER